MEDAHTDLVIVGSGAAGLCAAIVARAHGLRVTLLEKEPVLGGTTALSGGWAWIPGSAVASRAGVVDSIEDAMRYPRHGADAHFSAGHAAAYLEHGPRMIDFLERKSEVRFMASPAFPDYHSEAPGAALGRSIVVAPYDARELGENLALLRRPLPQTTLFGLNVGSGTELAHFFNATRSPASALFVLRRISRHVIDVLCHGRGTRLANGNALVARLLKSAFAADVEIQVSIAVQELLIENGAVVGVIAEGKGGYGRAIRARRGVLLACGGFSQDVSWRRALFTHAPTGKEHASPVPTSNVGDGLRLGESAGGSVERGLRDAAAWMPVSLVPCRDGTHAVFPHVVDRAKPGMIAVTRHGVRFVNESNSYHDFGRAMIAATRGEADPCVFLVCDHRAISRYGLGFVRPFPFPLGRHVASGYLLRGRTITELATAAGIDAGALVRTVEEFNREAPEGRDSRFGKGSTRYNRFQGDAMHRPNECLTTLDAGPFYAVRLVMGDIGTFSGLRADEHARVLRDDDEPVPGLYVAGNDMCSIMGGNYPGAGINIGPALTFAYIAAKHAAARVNENGYSKGLPDETVSRASVRTEGVGAARDASVDHSSMTPGTAPRAQ